MRRWRLHRTQDLGNLVIIDLKIVLIQVGDDLTLAIGHHDIEHNQLSVDLKVIRVRRRTILVRGSWLRGGVGCCENPNCDIAAESKSVTMAGQYLRINWASPQNVAG